jgi:hypothetical protein
VGGERFTARIQVANYGPRSIHDGSIQLDLRDPAGNVVAAKELQLDAPQGELSNAGTVVWDLPQVKHAGKYTLVLKVLPGEAIRNTYPLWIYPAEYPSTLAGEVSVMRTMGAELMKKLATGKSVLLIPNLDGLSNSVEGFFASDFWCYPMFRNIASRKELPTAPGTLGILCNPEHPALSQFPTEYHSNWQWWHLVMNSRAIVLDDLPQSHRPLVQVIDNFERNHKLGLIFECRVGNGRLLVCSIDLPALQDRPEARQLYFSLLKYMNSDAFDPGTKLEPALVAGLFDRKDGQSGTEADIDYRRFFNPDE